MAHSISGWLLTASKRFCQIPALTLSRKRLKKVAFAKFFGQVTPGAACAHDPQHGLCKQALVRASLPCIARLAQAVRDHQCPPLVIQSPFFPWQDAAQKGNSQQALGHHAMNKGAQIALASCLSWVVPCSFFACSKPAGSRGEAVRAETLMACSARPGSARLAPSGSLRRGRRPASRGAGGR